MKFTWGTGILVFIILFIAFMAFMVTKSSQQNTDLIATDYYARELAYEDQLEKVRNYNDLESKPVIKTSREYVSVEFPGMIEFSKLKGTIKLIRPSDKVLDRAYDFKDLDTNLIEIQLENMTNGLYSLELEWTDLKKNYLIKKDIVIQ